MIDRGTEIMIDLRHISTPREKCTTLGLGPISSDTLEEAERNRYDQLPVLDDTQCLCGLIATTDARALHTMGQELSLDSEHLDLCVIKPEFALYDLLSTLERHRAVIHLADGGITPIGDGWFGLVTISDLNKHYFRSYIYPMFAKLEAALAEIIALQYEDHWVWIPWLSKHSQPFVIGRWEIDKRESVETSAVAGCDLRDLMAVLLKTPSMLDEVRFDLKTLKGLSHSLPELRNDVMHPVRALVNSKKTVAALRTQLEKLEHLGDDIVRDLEMHSAEHGHYASHLP